MRAPVYQGLRNDKHPLDVVRKTYNDAGLGQDHGPSGGRELTLSNLTRVLGPEDGSSKAEVLDCY
jgi:hypothetical protein